MQYEADGTIITEDCPNCKWTIDLQDSKIGHGQLQVSPRIGPLKENIVYMPKIFFESSKLVVVEQEGQKYNATLERRYVT